MQDINQQSKNPRGSSPPFQESEKLVKDGLDGIHRMNEPPVEVIQVFNPKEDARFVQVLLSQGQTMPKQK